MEQIYALMLAAGVPSGLFGLLLWWFKRNIDNREKQRDKREKEKEDHDKRIEELIVLNLQATRSTCVLAVATAKAVQRIPDAKCNGDMVSALEEASTIQGKEKDFLIKKGVEHIFG